MENQSDFKTGLYEILGIFLCVLVGLFVCLPISQNTQTQFIVVYFFAFLACIHWIANYGFYFENPRNRDEPFRKLLRIGFFLFPAWVIFLGFGIIQLIGLMATFIFVLYLSVIYRINIDPDGQKLKEPLSILLSSSWALISIIIHLISFHIIEETYEGLFEKIPFEHLRLFRWGVIFLLTIHTLILALLDMKSIHTPIIHFKPLKAIELPLINRDDFIIIRWFTNFQRQLRINYNKLLRFLNNILEFLVKGIDKIIRYIKAYIKSLVEQLQRILRETYMIILFAFLFAISILILYCLHQSVSFILNYLRDDMTASVWIQALFFIALLGLIILFKTILIFLFTQRFDYQKSASNRPDFGNILKVTARFASKIENQGKGVFGINNKYVIHGIKQFRDAFSIGISVILGNTLIGFIFTIGIASIILWVIAIFWNLIGFEYSAWLNIQKYWVSKTIIILFILAWILPKIFAKRPNSFLPHTGTSPDKFLYFLPIGLFGKGKSFFYQHNNYFC